MGAARVRGISISVYEALDRMREERERLGRSIARHWRKLRKKIKRKKEGGKLDISVSGHCDNRERCFKRMFRGLHD